MKLKLIFFLLAVTAVALAQAPMRNQEQLEARVGLYWTALLDFDYRAVYQMYPLYTRSQVTYNEWLQYHGINEGEQESAGFRLVSSAIESITCADDPNFSHLCEVHTRLRLESQDGTREEGLVSNVWEIDEDGNWYPSMPIPAGP